MLNVWDSEATALRRQVEDCQTFGGAPVCALYGWIQGTSMAAPHASGIAALIRARNPGLPPMAVSARLQNIAMPMSRPVADDRCRGSRNGDGGGQTSFYGAGLVDALNAGD